MKLKIAILHKEQQVKTRNYRVWITKHTVRVENDFFTLRKYAQSYFAPQPEQDVLLLDNKYVVYTDSSVVPLDRDWKSPTIDPKTARVALDDAFIKTLTQDLYSLKDCLGHMLKSWCSKLTIRKEKDKCDTAKSAEDSSYKSNEEAVEETDPSTSVHPADKSTSKPPEE